MELRARGGTQLSLRATSLSMLAPSELGYVFTIGTPPGSPQGAAHLARVGGRPSSDLANLCRGHRCHESCTQVVAKGARCCSCSKDRIFLTIAERPCVWLDSPSPRWCLRRPLASLRIAVKGPHADRPFRHHSKTLGRRDEPARSVDMSSRLRPQPHGGAAVRGGRARPAG
jgi:hypothetical protein